MVPHFQYLSKLEIVRTFGLVDLSISSLGLAYMSINDPKTSKVLGSTHNLSSDHVIFQSNTNPLQKNIDLMVSIFLWFPRVTDRTP
jgi:hypothetical protein